MEVGIGVMGEWGDGVRGRRPGVGVHLDSLFISIMIGIRVGNDYQ